MPPELVRAVVERRLIPFVGAGLSAGLGLPLWDELLERVAGKLAPELPYSSLVEMCSGDPLRIAEYLYILAGRDIGPLRHQIGQAVLREIESVRSASHVELVNLGAPLVYTTNYDELLERTYDGLGEPFSPVAIPKHIARGGRTLPEVVKYHGDLQFESTLVLTESSYFDRLDFESPMDIKFRADVLGHSVLFIGYGRNDVNVRIIWHRLMRMLRGVDAADRPASWIVRLESNPALSALDAAVGIETIVLGPSAGKAQPAPAARVASFIFDLASSAASDKRRIPGSGRPLHMSTEFLLRARDAFSDENGFDRALAADLGMRGIPVALRDDVAQLVRDLNAASLDDRRAELRLQLTTNYVSHFGIDETIARSVDSDMKRHLDARLAAPTDR
jgi:hypothetical protein